MRTTIRVGDVEITAIADKAHDFNPGWHFPAVDPEAWEPYSDLIEGPDGYVLVNFHCFLIRNGSQTVLIDTGWGPELGPPGAPKGPGALMDDLEGLGRDIKILGPLLECLATDNRAGATRRNTASRRTQRLIAHV